jgi:hypothetical protein
MARRTDEQIDCGARFWKSCSVRRKVAPAIRKPRRQGCIRPRMRGTAPSRSVCSVACRREGVRIRSCHKSVRAKMVGCPSTQEWIDQELNWHVPLGLWADSVSRDSRERVQCTVSSEMPGYRPARHRLAPPKEPRAPFRGESRRVDIGVGPLCSSPTGPGCPSGAGC